MAGLSYDMTFLRVGRGTCDGVGMATSGTGPGQAGGSHEPNCQALEPAVSGCAEWCCLSSLLMA